MVSEEEASFFINNKRKEACISKHFVSLLMLFVSLLMHFKLHLSE